MIEIHAKKARHQIQWQQDGSIHGQHLHDFVGAVGGGRQVHIYDAEHKIAVALDELQRQHQMIEYVAVVQIEMLAYKGRIAVQQFVDNLTVSGGNTAQREQNPLNAKGADRRRWIRALINFRFQFTYV